MDIKLTPEQIDQLVRETILKSSVGAVISGAIQKVISPGYNSPIDEALKGVVKSVTIEIIEADYKPQIAAAVRAAIESKITPKAIENITAQAVDKIVRAAEDRY